MKYLNTKPNSNVLTESKMAAKIQNGHQKSPHIIDEPRSRV